MTADQLPNKLSFIAGGGLAAGLFVDSDNLSSVKMHQELGPEEVLVAVEDVLTH